MSCPCHCPELPITSMPMSIKWGYACDCTCRDVAADCPASMLRLCGTTDPLFADFGHTLSFELSLFCDQLHPGDEIVHPWRLSLVDDLDEFGIPALLEGVMTLPETIWSDLKENQFFRCQGAVICRAGAAGSAGVTGKAV